MTTRLAHLEKRMSGSRAQKTSPYVALERFDQWWGKGIDPASSLKASLPELRASSSAEAAEVNRRSNGDGPRGSSIVWPMNSRELLLLSSF